MHNALHVFKNKIFKFLPWILCSCRNTIRFDKKAKVNFKIYGVTDWTTNNYNNHITNILRREVNQKMKFCQLIEYNMRNIFLG